MDRIERAPILQSNNTSNQSTTTHSQFNVTPYKICVSALISVFIDDKSNKTTQRDVGMFCLICMKCIQSLDCNYHQFLQQLSQPFVSNKVKKKMMDKLNDMTTNGLSQLMELMSSLKQITYIQRSSIVGLFIRRMWLYFDKLSFSAVSQLFDDLVDYISDHSLNKKDNKSAVNKFETCPQQMQYFISKQLNLIQINEKKAMTPFELLDAIKRNFDTTDIGIASPQNDFNDIHFLKYLNALRVNEFAAAKESLMAYFDGNSNQMSRCWAALNLAILHSHFNHNQWAIQAIKECISAAQESNDEKCLEFALMWVSRVISQTDSDCDVSLLLNHLQSKANELGLPYISSLSQLQSEQLKTTCNQSSNNDNSCSPSLTSSTPGILAVRHSMNDVLMMSYSSRAALLNLYGASNLAALTSQVLLHLNVVEPVGESNVYHVNENTCIGVRNIALHLWRNAGQYSIARDMLLNLSSLYSQYKSDLNSICCQALAEIDFELNLNVCNWKSALKCIQIINSCDKIEANIKLAQIKVKQGDKEKAIALIDHILNSDQINKRSSNPYIKINALLLKGKILNDISVILECIDLCKQNRLIGLECSSLVELSLILQQTDQISQSQLILNSIMIRLLANGTCYDIAKAHYINAGNHFRIYELKSNIYGVTKHDLDIALKSNERAIELWKLIEDKESLKDSFALHANIYHKKQDHSLRNYFARQARLLQSTNDML